MSDTIEATEDMPLEFVTLIAGSQSFCIEITQIREIRRWTPVTILPHSPGYVLGVINLRGAVIPILDLGAKLGFGATDPSPRHVIIIISFDDRTIGLLVDSVSEILSVKSEELKETPRLREDETTRCVRGVIAIEDDMTRVIDLSTVMPARNEVAA